MTLQNDKSIVFDHVKGLVCYWISFNLQNIKILILWSFLLCQQFAFYCNVRKSFVVQQALSFKSASVKVQTNDDV